MKIDVIIGLIAFVIISAFLYLKYSSKLKIKPKKRKTKNNDILEVRFLMIAYNLKKEKLLKKKILLIISILDAFIISSVFITIQLLPWATIWKLLLGFVLLMGLIYAIYNIFGRILVKRGYDK